MTTTNLGLAEVPTNTTNPSVPVNDALTALDKVAAGTVTKEFASDSNLTLTSAEYLTSVLIFTDSPSTLTTGRDVIFPAHFPRIHVTNNTAQTLTLKKSGQVGVALAASESVTVVSGATDVVESSSTSGGGSGTDLGWFNVMDYGATGDGSTNDTAAIQAAIDAAETDGGGTVYFPVGVYVVSGALQDTSRSNAQLLLPRRDYVDTEQITIVLRGAFPPPAIFSVVGTTTVPDGHSIIKGTLNSGTGSLIGAHGPSGTLEDFTNLHLVVRDLTFRMPSNPVLTACDFSKVAAVDLDNVIVDVGSYYIGGYTEPTTSTSFGVRLPTNNNGAMTRLGTVNVGGFYKGFEFAEHTTGFHCQTAWGCKQAFVFTTATNHASHFERLMAVHCERVMVATGVHYVDIGQLNVEHATSGWRVTDYDIDDASNYLKGSLRWHVVLAGTGVDSTFTVNSATGIVYTRLQSTSAGMTTLAVAASDETTAITTGTAKVTFRNPFPTAFIVSAVKASLTTAQTSGSIFTVDINDAGTSILSTKLTIDNTEKTSTTAATAAVISDRSIAADAEITVDVDQVGDGTAKGLKVYLLGYPS